MTDDSTVFDFMMHKYNEAAVPLREREKENVDRIRRREDIAQELEVIRAKTRLAERLTDEAIVNGTGNADALRQEQALLKQSVSTLEAEDTALYDEIKREREDIRNAFKNLARTIFNRNFPEVREKALDAISECIAELEDIWTQLSRFEAATGPCLSAFARKNFRPRRWGDDITERNLSQAINRWFQ